MSLTRYNRKRTFSKTPEPKGVIKRAKEKKLMFVIQKHHASHLHYDFRLEFDGVLKSWAVPKGPSLRPQDKRLAMEVEDHPISYATFEGTIPKGNYGAGEVIVWDMGTYEPLEGDGDLELSLRNQFKKGRLKIVLHGKKINGAYSLSRMRENQWLLIKKDDEFARDDDITEQINSVLSKRTLANAQPKRKKVPQKKIVQKNDPMPREVKPMLATLVDQPFDDPEWIYEIKWDGYRAIAELDGEDTRLYSRNNIDFNKRYPAVVEALKTIRHRAVLDGEIVAVDESGKTNFQLMQQAYKKGNVSLLYYVFDLLYLDGEDVRGLSLRERREKLKKIIPKKSIVRFSDDIQEKGVALFNEAKKEGMEGIIAKEASSKYIEGKRTNAWLKIKTEQRQEAVIAGFTEPRGSRKKFGALVLGAYVQGELTYIGHTGGGFNEGNLSELYKKLQPLAIKTSPFQKVPKTNMPVTWVKPKLVCEVKFSEWTTGGQMRHPIFIGLRIDKKPKEVIKESVHRALQEKKKQKMEPAEDAVSLSNLDKIYFPKDKITKGDVVRYYEKIADTIMPYLKDRPQNMNRHPNGIEKPGFFQKDFELTNAPDFIQTEEIFSESNNKNINYLVCNNKETLLYMANLGCIEINPWNSRIQNLENPDYMVIDLDPGDNTFEEVVKVAQTVHRVLDKSCEKHYCKTSGKTGLHIFVPLQAAYTYDQVKNFCELMVRIVNKQLPEITSLERSPAKRKHKIYLDYLQNRYGQTLCAPYSVRPAPGAPVSTPLKWSEVKKGLDPKKFTIKTILKRLEKYGDLWKPVLTEKVNLAEAISCLEKMMK